jgi:hypothetical protein
MNGESADCPDITDTSALAKLYRLEVGSAFVDRLHSERDSQHLISASRCQDHLGSRDLVLVSGPCWAADL